MGIDNASNLPQAGGRIPAFHRTGASRLEQSGVGGSGGLIPNAPAGPQNGTEGSDGGILIYEDIG